MAVGFSDKQLTPLSTSPIPTPRPMDLCTLAALSFLAIKFK
jgi:hypothetical protein